MWIKGKAKGAVNLAHYLGVGVQVNQFEPGACKVLAAHPQMPAELFSGTERECDWVLETILAGLELGSSFMVIGSEDEIRQRMA